MKMSASTAARHCHLRIPSELGFEKVARDMAWTVAKGFGLSSARCEDLRTAVSEATLNAMEHGNLLDPASNVDVTFALQPGRLEVCVRDEGLQTWQAPSCPSISDKVLAGARHRSMGLMLMRALVDELNLEPPQENQGTCIKMVVYG